MDDLLGFGGMLDLDGDGSLDVGETVFGLMMMDDELADESTEEEDCELELMTGYSRDDLELMDSEERAEVLEEAGYGQNDFGFDDF